MNDEKEMTAVSVRLPTDLYKLVKISAAHDQRSISKQIIVMLQAAMKKDA